MIKIRYTKILLSVIVVYFTYLTYRFFGMSQSPSNLIILPCHSIYTKKVNVLSPTSGIEANEWILAPFQVEANDHLSFIEHIKKSSDLIERKASVLIISGGFTKSEIKMSESQSYFNLGINRGWYSQDMLNNSIHLEEYARDSYENVLFSLCKFHQLYNKHPKKVTVIGFEFKKPRFIDSHLKVLGYNDLNVEYIGIGPDFDLSLASKDTTDYVRLKEAYYNDLHASEKKFALDLFKENPFGSKGSKLHQKKLQRDPWEKSQEIPIVYNYGVSEPLKHLVAIDQLELQEALNVYNSHVLNHLSPK